MAQPIADSIAFLTEARHAIEDLSVIKDREAQLKLDEKRLEKVLESEKKSINDSINMTIKQRAAEINSSYDQAISKGQEQLKKAGVKREKAKTQGIKDRISEETSQLREHNRELKVQMKTTFQKDRVPLFCNSNLYYSLYFPRWFKELLTLLCTISICFLLIPCVVYWLIPKKELWYLIGIYFIDVILFGGIYIFISNKTKMFHMEALKAGRAMKDQMHANNKKIRVITSTINKDRNETLYDLEKYDDEISKFRQELTEIANKKKEALNTFENVTKIIISDEITNSNKARIDKIQNDFDQVLATIRDTENQVKVESMNVTDHYEIYLGKEFLDPLKIAELSELIKSGKASNLTEAISVYRESKN